MPCEYTKVSDSLQPLPIPRPWRRPRPWPCRCPWSFDSSITARTRQSKRWFGGPPPPPPPPPPSLLLWTIWEWVGCIALGCEHEPCMRRVCWLGFTTTTWWGWFILGANSKEPTRYNGGKPWPWSTAFELCLTFHLKLTGSREDRTRHKIARKYGVSMDTQAFTKK